MQKTEPQEPHKSLELRLLDGVYAVCQLGAAAPIPAWAEGEGFLSISRSDEELSIVCLQERVPRGVKAEQEWSCLKLEGPFEFSLSGILASVLEPLAAAGVGIFAISTYNTDYVLVKRDHLEKTVHALESVGHTVQTRPLTQPKGAPYDL